MSTLDPRRFRASWSCVVGAGVVLVVGSACGSDPAPAAAPEPTGLQPHITPAHLPPALAFARFGETTVADLRARMIAALPHLEFEQFDDFYLPAGDDPAGDPVQRFAPAGQGTQLRVRASRHSPETRVDGEISDLLIDFRLLPGRTEPVLTRIHASGPSQGPTTLCDHAAPLADHPLDHTCAWISTPLGRNPDGQGTLEYLTCVGDEDAALPVMILCEPSGPYRSTSLVYELHISPLMTTVPPGAPLAPLPPPVAAPNVTAAPGVIPPTTATFGVNPSGALACSYGTYTLTGVTLTGPTTAAYPLPAVQVSGTCALTLVDSTITNLVNVTGGQLTLRNTPIRPAGPGYHPLTVSGDGHVSLEGSMIDGAVALDENAVLTAHASTFSSPVQLGASTARVDDQGENSGL